MTQRLSRATLMKAKSPRRRASVRPLLEALEGRLVPASYTVNSTLDTGAGSGTFGDLRYCLTQANKAFGSTITFDATKFATHQTITLNGTELPVLTANRMTITGPAAGVTISGNSAPYLVSRVLEIGVLNVSNPNVTLSGLTITQGQVSGNGGGILDFSTGTVTLTNCTLSGNSAYVGGGLYNYNHHGTVALSGCTLSGNSSGGLFNAGTATLVNCTLSGNFASGFGGGLENAGGSVALVNCTLSGNFASSGGGLFNLNGTAALVNCTLSGNTANNAGGGLFSSFGSVALTNCTLAGNSAGIQGGGLGNNQGTVTLTNTLVAGNTQGSTANDIQGSNVASASAYNLIGTGGAGGLANGVNHNQVGVANPLLAPLGNYGGPTPTLALLPGSPAIDAGTTGTGIPTTDQRGKPRVGAADIGAFESQGFILVVQGGANQQALPNTALPVNFAVRVIAKNGAEPVQGGAVSFRAPASGPGGTFPGPSLTATAAVNASGIATAPPFTSNATFGAFTVTASAKGGNAVLFHAKVVAAAVVNSNLMVVGTNGKDTLTVQDTGTQFKVHVNGVSYTFAASLVTGRVIVSGYAGNDTITLIGKFPAEVHAGAGSDLIHGGDGGNVLYGGSGSLTAYAGAGDDVLIGGSGKATLYGGKGKAVLIGGSIKAGMGFDTYDALAKLAANWAAGDTSQEAALKAAIAAGAADALHAGTGGTWGFAAAAGDCIGFKAGRDKQTLLT